MKTLFLLTLALVTILSMTSVGSASAVSSPASSVTNVSLTPIPHAYDMSDPNVKAYPIYATARTAAEFQAGMAAAGKSNWRSAAETIAIQRNDDPDYLIDGKTFYDWRMKPIQTWVDKYLKDNNISAVDKTDYEKTAIIRKIAEDETRYEEFIGLWRAGFRFARDAAGNIDPSTNCVPRAEAVKFLMIAMDFKLFDTVGSDIHAFNAYWDDEAGAVRFIDTYLGANLWNLYVDELDSIGHILD